MTNEDQGHKKPSAPPPSSSSSSSSHHAGPKSAPASGGGGRSGGRSSSGRSGRSGGRGRGGGGRHGKRGGRGGGGGGRGGSGSGGGKNDVRNSNDGTGGTGSSGGKPNNGRADAMRGDPGGSGGDGQGRTGGGRGGRGGGRGSGKSKSRSGGRGGRGGRGGGKSTSSAAKNTNTSGGGGGRDRSDSVATEGSGKSGGRGHSQQQQRSGKRGGKGGKGKSSHKNDGRHGHGKKQQHGGQGGNPKGPHQDAPSGTAPTDTAGADEKLFATTPTLGPQGPPQPGQRGVLSLPTGFALPPLTPTQLVPTTYEEHSAAVVLSSPLRSPSHTSNPLTHESPGRSPKPIYKRFDSHEDDFYSGEFRAERTEEMHEEQHLAERMAAMVVESDGDDDATGGGIADFGDLGGGGEEEEKKDEAPVVGIGGGGLAPTSRFAAAAANLSKEAADEAATATAGAASADADAETDADAAKKKKKKKRNKKKKGKGGDGDEGGEDGDDAAAKAAAAAAPKPVTTTEAIGKLKQQEVSIGTSTKVQMRRNDSALSLDGAGATGAVDADGMPIINLLPADDATGGKKGNKKDKKKKGKGKSKALGGNEAENQRAARRFNRNVRGCVENSDAAGLADLLRDRGNHNFALEPSVLETVMKAYVVAAMFEDALYCLRNCALPGTLKIAQTERILTCLPQNLRNSSAFTAADMINQLCIATEFDLPTHRTYFMRLCRGIALEFLEEVTSARDRICSAPCERLVRSQVCVVDSMLRRGKKATELVVVPGHQLGVFIPEGSENRGIQAGDAVGILPYAGPYPMSAESLDRNMIEATVGNINSSGNLILRLQDKTNTRLYSLLTESSEGNVYRIDKLANRMGFNRQLSSAVSICAPNEALKDARRPSRELIKAVTAMDENIEHRMLTGGNVGRRNSSDELTSTAALCADAVPFFSADEKHDDDEDANKGDNADAIRAVARQTLEKYGAFDGLNGSQRFAVEGAATNRLTLIQGPPGTGKTAVAIRILQHWSRLAAKEAEGSGKPANPILATSDSNIAVDNLVEGCAKAGLRVIRLGRPEAIRPELLRHCIDRPGGNGPGGGRGGMTARDFKEKAKAIKNAEVICCTCIGSGSDIIDSVTFERVLVDEATQATEPAVLVPLARGCRQLVLVGDHCQLPPTVLSTRAEEEGLGVPLFSRMVACGVPPFMLDTQYRMHPAISMFCSDLFYGGKLLDGVSPPERRPLAGFPWPREEFPVAFVPVTHGFETDDGVSKLNEAEAAAACDAVSALIEGGCPPSEIAVVTPYAAQVRLIRRLTRKLLSQRGPPFVEVSSTDGFQGREKEAVVFSAVRSNDYGAVGFVSDWRRVNVSFTRARRALIVIGNDHTLRRGDPDTWAPWLQWADAHGLNMDSPGRPRGRYEPEQLRKVRGGTTAAEMLKDVLARQQAQTKAAEHQLLKAEKNAKGHIMGTTGGDDDSIGGGADGADGAEGSGQKALQQDLAALANEDGCWDDSDDDDDGVDGQILSPSISRTTLATSDSGGDEEDEDPEDAWDL